MSGRADGNVWSTCRLYPFVKSSVPSVPGCARVCVLGSSRPGQCVQETMHKACEFINSFLGQSLLRGGITASFNFCSCFSVFVKIQSSVSRYTRLNQLRSCFRFCPLRIAPGSQQHRHCTTGMNLAFREAPGPYLSE